MLPATLRARLCSAYSPPALVMPLIIGRICLKLGKKALPNCAQLPHPTRAVLNKYPMLDTLLAISLASLRSALLRSGIDTPFSFAIVCNAFCSADLNISLASTEDSACVIEAPTASRSAAFCT